MTNVTSFQFPLPNVNLHIEKNTASISGLQLDENTKLNQHEFALSIPFTANISAKNGTDVYIHLHQPVNHNLIQLYLNGSVLAAILHQRKTLSFHASAFAHNGKAILLCGDSEVGKSSLNMAFCLSGENFISDDTVPVYPEKEVFMIQSLGTYAKLWQDSLEQLSLSHQTLNTVASEDEKYLYPISENKNDRYPLGHIFIIQIHTENKLIHQHLKGTEAFEALRNQVYRKEYLLAMPDTEISFMYQLLNLSASVAVTLVSRPYNIAIRECKEYIEKLL